MTLDQAFIEKKPAEPIFNQGSDAVIGNQKKQIYETDEVLA